MSLDAQVKDAYVSVFSAVVKADQTERFLQALQREMPASAAEPGIFRFEVYRSTTDPQRFMIIDLYRDEAAFLHHCGAPHARRLSGDIAGCFAAPPTLDVCDVVAGVDCKARAAS